MKINHECTMESFNLDISDDWIIISFQNHNLRKFKKSIFKPFLFDLKKISFNQGSLEDFTALEQRVLKNYFFSLLAKKDYLSTKLIDKALMVGFDERLILQQIDFLISKGYIHDERFQAKKALAKVKKGYALRSLPGAHTLDKTEARAFEKEALIKLIHKKKDLLLSEDLKLKQKGYRFFLSRGYSIDQIKQHLTSSELS